MISIVSLTREGQRLGQRLHQYLSDCDLCVQLLANPTPFAQQLQQLFRQGHDVIFIGAIAIAVRVLAPVLKNKYEDPAVLVLDEAGQFVIPLLSGHQGGGNSLGDKIARLMDAQLVLTTAKPYLFPVYTVGIGCERHCPESPLQQLLFQCLETVNLQPSQLHSINSIDIKADEMALITLSKSLSLPFQTWDVASLKTVDDQLSQRSSK